MNSRTQTTFSAFSNLYTSKYLERLNVSNKNSNLFTVNRDTLNKVHLDGRGYNLNVSFK